MEKKTTGTFISALRKANGITQQELADMLNISNKAVSRWERDECAPDITLIPALAEILGVTCDELLKGERILSPSKQGKSEPKVDKQIKALINRSISNFKTLIWIALSLSIVGLLCVFGISYGFSRPIMGVILLCVFAASAFITTEIGTSRMTDMKHENTLFEIVDDLLKERFDRTVCNYSFVAFFLSVAVMAVGCPLLSWVSSPTDTVIKFEKYLMCFGFKIPVLGLLYLPIKNLYRRIVMKQPVEKSALKVNSKLLLMNALQLSTVALTYILFAVGPYIAKEVDFSVSNPFIAVGGIVLPALNAVVFVIFVSLFKSERKKYLFHGLRNLFLTIPSRLVLLSYLVPFQTYGQYSGMDIEYFLCAFGLILFIILVFIIINKLTLQKKK